MSKQAPGVLALAALAVLLAMGGSPVGAADPASRLQPAPVRPGVGADEAAIRLEGHLERLAALLLLRTAFDVIPGSAVPELLGNEAERLGAGGPADADIGVLDVELLSEASYYIVSLRYLVESGGAIWPPDRPEHFYVNDALVELAATQQALLGVIAAHADPLPLLARVNRVHAWTEGYAEIPPHFDFFSGRDALVDAALASHGPRSAT